MLFTKWYFPVNAVNLKQIECGIWKNQSFRHSYLLHWKMCLLVLCIQSYWEAETVLTCAVVQEIGSNWKETIMFARYGEKNGKLFFHLVICWEWQRPIWMTLQLTVENQVNTKIKNVLECSSRLKTYKFQELVHEHRWHRRGAAHWKRCSNKDSSQMSEEGHPFLHISISEGYDWFNSLAYHTKCGFPCPC